MRLPTTEEASWPELQRVRRAVVLIDMVESVRLLELHEADVIDRWRRIVRAVETQVLPKFEGRMVKSLGDGMLLEFVQPAHAVQAAIEVCRLAPAFNAGRDANALIRLRIGVNVCDVVVDANDIFGHGVNVAARLRDAAEPGEIWLTAAVNEALLPGLDVETEDLGDRYYKHLNGHVRTYRVCSDAPPREDLLAGTSSLVLMPSVAVLPFATEGEVEAGLAIGELLADDLICALSALPDLHVVSHLSTAALAQRGEPVQRAGEVLNADFVLSGSCRVMGAQMLVQAQLFDIRRSEVVRNFRHAGAVASLLTEDSPVVALLLAEIGAVIVERQVDLARHCAMPNLAGYTLLLGGIALMHRLGQRDFWRARDMLEHLRARWPRLSAPHAWHARWHLFNVMQGHSIEVEADRRTAFESSARALELDPASSVALAVAGSVKIGLARDVDAGISLYQEALRCNPNDSFAWMLLGTAHAFKGVGGPACEAAAQAIRLSPLDPMHFMYDCHAAGTALAAEDYARARSLAQRSMRANAQHLSTYRVLAIAHHLLGESDAAKSVVERLRALDPKQSVDGYLRNSPSADYPIGKLFAKALGEAGLPQAAA